jgi:hypothetical protein
LDADDGTKLGSRAVIAWQKRDFAILLTQELHAEMLGTQRTTFIGCHVGVRFVTALPVLAATLPNLTSHVGVKRRNHPLPVATKIGVIAYSLLRLPRDRANSSLRKVLLEQIFGSHT